MSDQSWFLAPFILFSLLLFLCLSSIGFQIAANTAAIREAAASCTCESAP